MSTDRIPVSRESSCNPPEMIVGYRRDIAPYTLKAKTRERRFGFAVSPGFQAVVDEAVGPGGDPDLSMELGGCTTWS